MELSYKQSKFELTKELSEEGSFEGYVAVFNNVDFGGDIIDPEAFSGEPVGKSYPFLADHETRAVIGNYKISIDSYGVKMTPASFNLMRDEKTGAYMIPKAAEKYANLKNGDISGFSIGYSGVDSEFKEINGERVRVITKATLREGSVVTFPMNDKARLTQIKETKQEMTNKQELLEKCESLKELETVLKDGGFSGKQATTIVAKVKEFSSCDKKDNCEADEERDATLESLQSIKTLINDSLLKDELNSINNLFKK